MNPSFNPGPDLMYKSAAWAAGADTHGALIDEMLLRLEAEDPNPLLARLATGFPSALLCVLATGVLAGALAGRQVGGPALQFDRPAVVSKAALAAAPGERLPALPVQGDNTVTSADVYQPATSLFAARHDQLMRAEQLAWMGSPSGR